MKSNLEEDESYCLSRLGISNARGAVARRLREVGAFPERDELMQRPLSRGRYLVVDLETTGMKAGKSRIIEIGAVEVDGFTLGRELSSLVYPGVPVPPFISALTGINTSMVMAAPRLHEILPILERILQGRVLVAHNLSFDHSFLRSAWTSLWGRDLDVPSLCTVKLARRAFRSMPSHNLDAVASHLCIRTPSNGSRARHRALGDARITAVALVRICQELEREGRVLNVGELLKFQDRKIKREKRSPDRVIK